MTKESAKGDNRLFKKEISVRQLLAQDMKGMSQLAEQGTLELMALVETMHQNVFTLGGLLSQQDKKDSKRTNGITGLVYRAINKTTALSFKGINLALATFSPLIDKSVGQFWEKYWYGQRRNQWLSALNGLLGDQLAESDNPLALNMQLIYQGRVIDYVEAATLMDSHDGESLLLVHGLCMNDELWVHEGHEHGATLSESHNQLCFYLRYNTGRAIHKNGQQLSGLLDAVFSKRTGRSQLNILCHSMGGLVARSALSHAVINNKTWSDHVNKTVFLGTPHQGATLEKAGNVLDYLLTISPYSAPFAKLTRSRSQGIQDLQHGCIHHSASLNEIPKHIMVHAVAASRSKLESMPYVSGENKTIDVSLKGDGLVTVSSAVADKLMLKDQGHQQWLLPDCNHMELLGGKASELLNLFFK